MKIKLEVNVNDIINDLFDDFNPEYDTIEVDLKESVKDEIKRDISLKVSNMYDVNYKNHIAQEIKKMVKEKLDEMIAGEIYEFSKNGIVKDRSNNDVSLKEFISSEFEHHKYSSYNSLKSVIVEQCKSHVEEIKSRYDLLFASQIITKLNDQDLLKEGVFKALMESNK